MPSAVNQRQSARAGEMLLPAPHPGQKAIRRRARRFNWLAAGRRWRKTTMVMAIAAESAMRGARILWGAPTFDQCRIGWQELRHGCSRVCDFNQTEMTCTFPSGGTVAFRSLDNPDAARGHTADGIVLDECGDIKPEAWSEVLRPMLVDTGGWSWGVGSPRGLNWFWREWLQASDRPDSTSWQAPTLGVAIRDGNLEREPHPLENPFVPFEEIQRLWGQMSERTFAQEILAEFVELGGGVFRHLDDACVESPLPPEPGRRYALGVDWALTHDFTALCVLDITARPFRQVALDRFNRIDYTFQLERLMLLVERYKPWPIIAETNAMGGPLVQDLQRRGLPVWPFTTTAQSKRAAVEALSLALEHRALKLLSPATSIGAVQKGELLAFQAEQLPSGQTRYAAPDDGFDDCVMALAMAWQAVVADDLPVQMVEVSF